MSFQGHIEKGMVILDRPLPLPDGTPVLVEPLPGGFWQAPSPNQAMLKAMEAVEQVQMGMHPKEDQDTLKYLREARSGGMYGYDNTD